MSLLNFLVYSPLTALFMMFALPSLIDANSSLSTQLFIITLFLGYFIGFLLSKALHKPNSLSKYRGFKHSRISQATYMLVTFIVLFSLIIWFYNVDALSAIIDGESVRDKFYEDQWNINQSKYFISKYVTFIFIFYPIFLGWNYNKFNKTRRILGFILLVAISITKLLMESRLFILYILIFGMVNSMQKRLQGGKIFLFGLLLSLFISLGFYLRYGDVKFEYLLVFFDGYGNLKYVVEEGVKSGRVLAGLVYDLTLIPGGLLNYSVPNLTELKYGSAEGSSEPMPVLASIFYSVQYLGFVYYVLIGYYSHYGRYLVLNHKPKGVFVLLSIFYVSVLYVNHSGFRAASRFFILVLTFLALSKFAKWILRP